MASDHPGTQEKYNKVLTIIDERLIPDEHAKKLRGEVFTPLSLVLEMLYGMRKKELEAGKQEIWGISEKGDFFDDDEDNRVGGIPLEVWQNPESTFLDPANGIGNFPVVAFQILDYQLGKHSKDPKYRGNSNKEQRRKHIIEKMLFMIEIDKGNVNATRKIFNLINSSIKPNICCADTLLMNNDNLKRVFGVNQFDVVMGNPPFQKPKLLDIKGGYGGRTLWDKFVFYSLKLLKTKESKLVFLHPPAWRKPESELWDLMTHENSIEFLRIFPKSQTYFDISQRFDYYVLSHIKQEKTIILDELNVLNFIKTKEWRFLPNCRFKLIHTILVTNKSYGINVLYSSSRYDTRKPWISNVEAKDYKYPIIHEMNQKGKGIKWTNKPDFDNEDAHFGTKKVILSFNEKQYPFNDYKGEFGMSQITFGIPIKNKEEGDQIVNAINSEDFRNIIAATKWGAFQTDYRMFRYITPDFWRKFVSINGGFRKTIKNKAKTYLFKPVNKTRRRRI
jgi:hypothetical protein